MPAGQEGWDWDAVAKAMQRQRGVRGNMTQEDLAAEANVGIQFVRELEQGNGGAARRGLNNLAAVSQALWRRHDAIERIAQGEDIDGASELEERVSALEAELAELRADLARPPMGPPPSDTPPGGSSRRRGKR